MQERQEKRRTLEEEERHARWEETQRRGHELQQKIDVVRKELAKAEKWLDKLEKRAENAKAEIKRLQVALENVKEKGEDANQRQAGKEVQQLLANKRTGAEKAMEDKSKALAKKDELLEQLRQLQGELDALGPQGARVV